MSKEFNKDFYAIPEGALAALLAPKIKRGGIWEAGVFEAPFVIPHAKGEFHPLGSMAVDSASYFILNAQVFDQGTSPIQILGDVLLESMSKHHLIPESILLIGSAQTEALEPFARLLGVTVKTVKRLPAFESALKSMTQHIQRKAAEQEQE